MSKSTTLKASSSSGSSNTKKLMGSNHREPSRDRNSTRKGNLALTEKTNQSPTVTNVKSKPSVKQKEISPSSNANAKSKILKIDLNKADSKLKLKSESNRISLNTTSKSSTVNGSSKPVNKSSISPYQKNSTKPKRSTAPDTPPSSRVTKTQYFPTKRLYSNAIEGHLKNASNAELKTSNDSAKVSPTDRSKTRTLNRSEIKIAKNENKETKSKLVSEIHSSRIFNNAERPRTATLKKGSIVNSNIAGPDIPKSETVSLTSLDLSYEQEIEQDEQDNYEDDFDSYESDFEEYQSSDSTSSISSDDLLEEEGTTSDDISSLGTTPKQNIIAPAEEERMLDSGNFDLPENKHKQLLDNIKESNEHEHFVVQPAENNRSNMASLSDEGFEEGKSSLQSGNMQFINFAEAQRKCKYNKNLEKRRKRGEDILSMIRLDYYNFTLFDMSPVSYDVFIRSYGKTNTVQVPTQTGCDDISEEVQTDNIETVSKWTQFPIVLSKTYSTDTNYLEIYKQEYAGVGGDSSGEENLTTKPESVNLKQLDKFISFASQFVLILLDESFCNATDIMEKNSREIPFSNGYIKFNAKACTFLKERPVSFVTYCSTTNIKILTGHGRITSSKNSDENILQKSLICIWNILKCNEPENILSVTGELSCCCFISDFKNMVTGGLNDGSLVAWDIGNNRLRREVVSNTEKPICIQEPSYVTEINRGHTCKVIAIQQILQTNDDILQNIEWKIPNNQIFSLDENGMLIVWGIILRDTSSLTTITENVPFSNELGLVQNSKFLLKEYNPELTDLLCTDMNVNPLDPNHILISTNYGYVIHFLTTGTKANPKKYNNPGTVSQANCLESCPFSSLYFVAGYEDGAIVLFSRLLEKPLMTMSNKEDDTYHRGVQLLQWSYDRPCVFYAKDFHNTIHVWDLGVSDLYPVYSIPFKENITSMKLSPIHNKNNDASYMVLATEDGSIYLHILKPDYGPSNLDHYQQDVKKFLNYVSRL